MRKFTVYEKIMIGVFNALYILVSVVSINHLFEFLSITDSTTLAVLLSVGYALGTAASIFSFTLLNKVSKTLVYSLFILLMSMEILGNVYHTYSILTPEKIKHFAELFALNEWELHDQKRILAIISGLPIVLISMGYIKMLINYLFPDTEIDEKELAKIENVKQENIQQKIEQVKKPIQQIETNLNEYTEGLPATNRLIDDILGDDDELHDVPIETSPDSRHIIK